MLSGLDESSWFGRRIPTSNRLKGQYLGGIWILWLQITRKTLSVQAGMLQEAEWNPLRLSMHPDRPHRQRCSRLSPTHSLPTAAGSSQQVRARRLESALDESARAYRTTALHQLNANPKPRMRGHHQRQRSEDQLLLSSPSSSRPVPQPVLVRAYSGNASVNRATTETPKQPSTTRRFLSFLGFSSTSSASNSQPQAPQLPSADDFSIGCILQAIEPNIQGTLDSIAEIYGRSKLSLANEYGSHIAPLGEIRAPPGHRHLLTVDEASSEQERQTQENGNDQSGDNEDVDIYGDDCDQTQQEPGLGDRSSVQAEPDTPFSSTDVNPGFETMFSEVALIPVTKEFSSKPKSSGRALLGGDNTVNSTGNHQSIFTPAVVSEVYLDAQAEYPQEQSDIFQEPSTSDRPQRRSVLSEMQSLFSFISRSTRGQSNGCHSRLPAETQLRAVLNSRGA